MADYWLNSNFTGTSDGSESAPWKALSDLHGKNYDAIDNIYIASGTTYTATGRSNLQLAQNLNITSYDAGYGSAKPILESYKTIADTGSWAEVQNDGSTPVVSAGDTNVWRFDLGTAFANNARFVVFTSLDAENAGLRTKWFVPDGLFSDFDQTQIPSSIREFDLWKGDANLNSSLYVYSPQNPFTEYGTVYYQSSQWPVFMAFASTNITVDGLSCRNSFSLLELTDDAGRVVDSENIIVRNCDFNLVLNAVTSRGGLTDTWAYTGLLFEDNTITNSTGSAFAFASNVRGGTIRRNTLNNIGLSESPGGIYFGAGSATAANPILVYENNINDVASDRYWTRDGAGLYSDENVKNTHFFRNIVTNCLTAMKDNSGSAGNKFYSNVAKNCPVLFEIGDSAPYGNSNTIVYNNTLVGGNQNSYNYLDPVDRQLGAIRVLGTARGAVDFINNIVESIVDNHASNAAFYIDTSSTVTYTINNTIYNNYTEAAIDHNGAPILLPVGNNIDIDPLFISTTDFNLQSTSPCVGTGVPKWWGNSARPDTLGEPLPDTAIDIGAYQSLWDANHPVNL